MIIAIDFDGTCVTHHFPKVGKDIGAVPVLKSLVNAGHKLILFTMRCDHDFEPSGNQPESNYPAGNYLTDALNWFKQNNIPLYGIQTNPEQSKWTSSPKAFADLYIDDSALGIPLKFTYRLSTRPYVNWPIVLQLLKQRHIL